MIRQVTLILLAILNLATGTASADAERRTAPGSQVVSGDNLTKQQFDALPDTALISFKGRQMTKASIRAREAQGRDMAERTKALARQGRAELQQRLVQFEQQKKSTLEADRAKATGSFARLGPAFSPELKAIEVEAAQLHERSLRASAAEKTNIEERAKQLLEQVRALERQ